MMLLLLIRAHDRSRLRLAAACGLLKLAKSSVHRDFITLPILQKLALTAQVCLCTISLLQCSLGHKWTFPFDVAITGM